MSKIIVPLHFQEQFAPPTSAGPGVKKFYLRNQWFKIYDGTSESDLVLDRPLDNFTPISGTITSADSVLSAIEKLDYAVQNISSGTLQEVVNTGNSISNFGGLGTASIQSTNFTNNRTLYLNDDAYPTIRIVDNLNASNNLQIDIDTLIVDGVSYNWSSIVNPPASPLSALPYTTDHLAVTNNQYVIGDLVWYLGNVYRCIANNDSIIPTSPLYWVNLGSGYPLVQQPADWSSTSGNNQILNKPTIPTQTSDLTNDGEDGVNPFISQEQVVEYADLASFPSIGTVGVIYIALDTDLAYVWDPGTMDYVLTSMPNTGITGIGRINRVAKFSSPTNLVWSRISEDNFGSVKIADSNRNFLNGNTVLSIQRTQTQMDFVLGNPSSSQPNIVIDDNIIGTEYRTRGTYTFKTGTLYAESFVIGSNGKLKISQTPDTGATSDSLLVRDSSGNVKQIAYPVQSVGFEQNFLLMGA
jgi:hypothetical protein